MRHQHMTFALLLAVAGVSRVSAQTPARQFLFKDDRGDLAAARARGDTNVTVIIAAMPGATERLARVIAGMGGTIRFRDDNVDYIRASVRPDSVDRLAHDPSVHALDLNMLGAD